MRFHVAITTLFASAFVLFACGDDSVTGGSPAGGANPGGANSDGGAGAGIPMISGGNNTGGEAAGPMKIGAACTSDADCDADGFCIAQVTSGFPKGYCSAPCDGDSDCGNGVCISDIQSPFCVAPCGDTADCRDGYTCQTLTPETSSDACYVGCTDSAQCAAPAECITDEDDGNFGLCIEAEVCDDTTDNDLDGLGDCNDSDCVTVAPCDALINTACTTDAIALTVGTTTGDTSDGSNLFSAPADDAGCPDAAGIPPGQEIVYLFTPPASGELSIELESTSDEDFGIYARTACADGATQVGCVDVNFGKGNNDESFALAVLSGVPVAVFVDAYGVAGGTYTLTTSFMAAVCGDGIVTLPEACDDSNVLPGDGCDALCEVELDFFCNAATPITLGTTTGNTSTGTNLFQAPVDAAECTAGAGNAPGLEVLYVFTPATSGMLTVALDSTSDEDFGLYARTDCVDQLTQVGCSDQGFQAGDNDESLTIPVTSGVPVTIFVDSWLDPGGAFSLALTQN